MFQIQINQQPPDDTPKTIINSYPQLIQLSQPSQIRNSTIRKFPRAFELLGAVQSSERLTEPLSQVLINPKCEKNYLENIISKLPKLIKILMTG